MHENSFLENLYCLLDRYTMERPRFSDHLEAIKFICKDFWSELFKKQIDNLKTNHRVIYRRRKSQKHLASNSFSNHGSFVVRVKA
ncbi:hypothetical protein BHM03_00040642 [Ensete ventricosum]|nr:hypothetical protein BHM03_00040642 [Ensete ventricosum]